VWWEYIVGYGLLSIPLVVSLILMRAARRHERQISLRFTFIVFTVFALSALYLSTQAPRSSGSPVVMGYTLGLIFIVLPILILFEAISRLFESRSVLIASGLIVSVPAVLVGVGYQTGYLSGFLSSLYVILFFIPYYLYVIAVAILVAMRLKK